MTKEKTVRITESELHTCRNALRVAMTIYSNNNAWSGYDKFEKAYDSLMKKESKLFKEKRKYECNLKGE